ncbi:MAG: DDE-type integrase/transposase/recombinase [Deferrisomatales bacterium]|nr:DDE-type integrase/transposase/recombinase [Deferrisomatales bacterium]
MTLVTQTDLAVWRYGLISHLLHRNDAEEPLEHELLRLAAKTFVRADGRSVRYSAETLRKWLYRYRHGGLPALADTPRKNLGRHDAVPEKLAERIVELRAEHPRWTLARILEQLIEERRWNMVNPSRATLYRYAHSHNLQRDPHLAPLPAKAFAYQYFGQLWSADFLHGPKIKVNSVKRKTYLHAIIDDATRYIVRSGFFLAEDTEVMIKELMAAIATHGKPLRFYTDNGACYASHHLKFACANLGIHLVHTPPGKPRGRGKVERYFRTVREQFLDGDTPVAHTLDGINKVYAQWLGRYHGSVHSSLGISPLACRLSRKSVCTPIPETIDIEQLFRIKRRCRVYLNNTIRLKKRSYELSDALPGQRVDVWFMPWDLSQVWYGPEMKPAKPVDLHLNAMGQRRER